MQQQTLDGIPQAQSPRNRGGRPKLPDEQKLVERFEVGVYGEDKDAIAFLQERGYGKTKPAVVRRALRLAAALENGLTPEEAGRLV